MMKKSVIIFIQFYLMGISPFAFSLEVDQKNLLEQIQIYDEKILATEYKPPGVGAIPVCYVEIKKTLQRTPNDLWVHVRHTCRNVAFEKGNYYQESGFGWGNTNFLFKKVNNQWFFSESGVDTKIGRAQIKPWQIEADMVLKSTYSRDQNDKDELLFLKKVAMTFKQPTNKKIEFKHRQF